MSPRHLVSRQDNGGANSSCINPDPQNTVADRINLAFNSSGPGYIVRLCQGREYYIDSPIVLFANGQEISTEGYPIEQENGTDLRATLFVNGPVAGGQGHTTAIAGTWRSLLNWDDALLFWYLLPTLPYYRGNTSRDSPYLTFFFPLFRLDQRNAMIAATSKFVISECVISSHK